MDTLLRKRITMQSFFVFDDCEPLWRVGPVGAARQYKVREDIAFSLENAPKAFISLLQSKNFSKLIIEVVHE